MSTRIRASKFIIKLGRFIQSTAVLVMRPDDLVEFSRQHYLKPDEIQDWCNQRRIQSGLTDLEHSLLEKIPAAKGSVLMLGLGGGREAIFLAKRGFQVTGVDFIPQMIELAKENARKNGVKVHTVVQEISRLNMPQQTYDLAWLSAGMYSCVPTKKRRVDMLKKIGTALKPGAYFIFGFLWNPQADHSRQIVFIKKLLAWLNLGYLQYEKGDALRYNQEFFHAFTSVEELQAEIRQAGFAVIDIQLTDYQHFAGAVVQKPF